MTDTVTALQGATVSPEISEFYRPEDTVEDGSQLDKDTFLKLLVAQLKYQDPLNPSNSEEFIATTAQFTTIEKLDQIAKQGENTALINSLSTAGSLVGRSITFTGADGFPVDAVVERSQLLGGEVVLVTEYGNVGLNQITGVGAPAGTIQPATDGGTTPVTTTTSSTDATDDEPEASPSTEQSTTVPTETSSTPNDSESEITA